WAQLANIACRAKEVLGVEELEAVADRGYYSSEEILACDEAGITVTLPKPITSGIEAKGRFGKQDFVYLSDEDVYRCPAGEHGNPAANGRDPSLVKAREKKPHIATSRSVLTRSRPEAVIGRTKIPQRSSLVP